jgi:hypothetical protein
MAPPPAKISARIEIDCDTLARLLANRQMQVCELKCLDPQSKNLIRKLCLDTCLKACAAKSS